jgi:hypothetical protein
MKYKPYAKVITNDGCLCAIYEPHPFRSGAISESLGRPVDTGIADDEWVWVYYDWCCNPIGISCGKPDGIEVEQFTTENLKLTWTTPECAQKLCDYLNMEPFNEQEKQNG